MNIRDIEYIIAVAEQGSFSGAAVRCHVSQPSLSAQIKKVEDQLGLKIFERTKRSVRLSLYGESFISHARRILSEVERMKSEAREQINPFTGSVSLGAIATVAPYFFPRILLPLKKQAPHLNIMLRESVTGILLKDLLEEKTDIALLSLPTDGNAFESVSLFDDPFFLAVAKDHPFSRLESIGEDQLRAEKLILLEDEHCFREQALSLCKSHSMQEDKAFQATSLETIRHVVAAGQGVTLMPGIARRYNDGVAYIPMAGKHYSRTIGAVWKKGHVRAPFFRAFAALLADI